MKRVAVKHLPAAAPTIVGEISRIAVALKNLQDAELAANYKMMISPGQIVDIGSQNTRMVGVQDTKPSAVMALLNQLPQSTPIIKVLE